MKEETNALIILKTFRPLAMPWGKGPDPGYFFIFPSLDSHGSAPSPLGEGGEATGPLVPSPVPAPSTFPVPLALEEEIGAVLLGCGWGRQTYDTPFCPQRPQRGSAGLPRAKLIFLLPEKPPRWVGGCESACAPVHVCLSMRVCALGDQ